MLLVKLKASARNSNAPRSRMRNSLENAVSNCQNPGPGMLLRPVRAERAQSGCGEGGGINPAAWRRTRVGAQWVLQYLDRPLIGGGIGGQRHVAGQAGRNPVRRCSPENLREFPARGQQAQAVVGELRYLIHQCRIEDVPAVGGECSADFVGLAVTAVESAVVGDRQPGSRITGAVADGQVADAMRPGVVGVDEQALAQALRDRQKQAVVAGGSPRSPAIPQTRSTCCRGIPPK